MKRNLSEPHILLCILVFVLLVPVLGLVNICKYLDFKLNGRIDYNEWTPDLGSKLETDIASSSFCKFQYLNLNGAVRNLLFQHEMNGVTKLNNGHLVNPLSADATDEALIKNAEETAMLKSFMAETGGHVLFMALPTGTSKYDPQLPAGVADYGNSNLDRLVEYMRAYGVDVIDIREEMHADGIDHYDMMYRSDHHWKTEAGFYAYGKLEPWLRASLGCETDPRIRDITQYTVKTYPRWHLGSYGQRTGVCYGGVDDFTVFYPEFDTTLQQSGREEIGSLRDVFYQESVLSDRDYGKNRYVYDTVLGGVTVESKRYINHGCVNDKRILVISNSFYKAIYPYLIMGFQDVQYLHYTDVPPYTTSEALRGTIQLENGAVIEGNYDAVVIMYEPSITHMGTPFAFLDGQ